MRDWIHGRFGGSKAITIAALPMTRVFSTWASAWSVSAITMTSIGGGRRTRNGERGSQSAPARCPIGQPG